MAETVTPPAVTPPPPQIPQAEMEAGKTMAILCYIPVAILGLIVAIICISQKNNAYSLYHAKQALTLYIIAFGAYLVCLPLIFICIGGPLMVAVGVGALVLCILGIVNASGGQCKPLPVIGQFADKWFGKIQKA